MKVLETSRLVLRQLTPEDAEFVLGLLNEPSFIANIGDKGIRTLEAARQFLMDGHIASYQRNGYGHYLVELKGEVELKTRAESQRGVESEPRMSIGMCGLIHREHLQEIDIGFAFLPAYWSRGYATEAAQAVKEYGHKQLGLPRIVGVVSPGNLGSIRVLEKLGLRYSRPVQLTADGDLVHLYT